MRVVVHTPQQNGVVKRKHRHIFEVARAIRFQGSITIKFWGECVLVVLYLINRLPTGLLQGQSPHEVFHQLRPSLDHLRTVGCLCYATTHSRYDKFSPRADACIMMGYSLTQKGYVLYILGSKKFLVSRDVIFKEDIFPFKQIKDQHIPIFPEQSYVDHSDERNLRHADIMSSSSQQHQVMESADSGRCC